MAAKRNIRKEIREKLGDEVLRDALGRFYDVYPAAREKALENVEDVEILKEQLKQMKADTVERLSEIAERFEREASKRGAKVFRAQTGDNLKDYILDLCEQKGVKRVVKSKSMASEEVDLNDALKEKGIRVKETDLGEWIISIAGHKPSHMVLPAIHLNRYQVADYFTKELDQKTEPDIARMVHTARITLRDEFLKADMGISGANFGIAENGAIGLVTNEGNCRLITSLPRIHVVIIGYEKLIPRFMDANTILRLLPRMATAQLMTSYMSIISGPTPIAVKRNGSWVEEKKELHIILLDNGRLAAAKDSVFREIYQCIRCASCLNVCPVYSLVGGHVYSGHTYAGGIGTILSAFMSGMEEFDDFNQLCIGCRMCTTVCPGKLNIPDLIEEMRRRSVNQKGLPFFMGRVFDVITNRRLFHRLLRTASVAQKPFTSEGLVRHLPLFFAGLTKERSLPAIAAIPLRDRVHRVIKKIENPEKRISFFCGCILDFVFPETGENVIKVIQDLNMEVVFPDDQGCCGKPVSAAGDTVHARKIAKDNIKAFEDQEIDVIICACPTGVEQLLDYPKILQEEPEWRERAEKLAAKVREFCSFVDEEYQRKGRLRQKSGRAKKIKATYHDSCHLKRVLNVYREPRSLLESSEGYKLTEMKNADRCCGMAGAFGVQHGNLSVAMLEKKMQNIKETGAEAVACACSGCMVQLQGGIDKQAPGLKLKHIADILAEDIERKKKGEEHRT